MKNLLIRLWNDEQGQDLTEYALLLVLRDDRRRSAHSALWRTRLTACSRMPRQI